MAESFHAIRNRLDRVGVLLSGLCAVHCLLSVFAVGALGIGSQVLLSPWIHRIGLALAIAVGLFTIALGAIRHRRMENLHIGGVGIGLMCAALLVGHGQSEAALTVVGVTLVAIAHIRNLRLAA